MKVLLFMILGLITYSLSAQVVSDSICNKIQYNDDSISIHLSEVVVNAAMIKHGLRSDQYIVTPELRKGATSVYDIISRLPGISYNNVNNEISVRMDRNVMIEVNGTQISKEYLQSLPVERIAKIEVIYSPSSRYTTEGIKYVIDIRLKNDFVGQDLYLANFMMMSLGNNNGNDPIANEQPKIQYIYSGEDIDFNIGYGFADINWNYPVTYSREYYGVAKVESGEVGTKSPNDCNHSLTHGVNTGFDWHIVRDHTISLRGSFLNNRVNHSSIFDISESNAHSSKELLYKEFNNEHYDQNEVMGALIYKGAFKNGLNVYSALGYDYIDQMFTSEITNDDISVVSPYKNQKKYFRGELDLNYGLNNYLSVNWGYRGVWNRYKTCLRSSGSFVSMDNSVRQNTYAYLDWTPHENMLLHTGFGIEYINKKDGIDSRYWIKLLPQITLTWQPSSTVQLTGEYISRVDYPGMYQLSLASTSIDKWLKHTGNPTLSPEYRHIVSLQGSIFNALIIGVEYIYSTDHITNWYEKIGENLFKSTFTNTNNNEFRIVAAYDWEIIKGLTWSNIIQWKWRRVSSLGLSNQISNFNMQSKLEYWIAPCQINARLMYCREMEKQPLLQGFQNFGHDMWQISFQKSFINNSLSVMLDYIPPVRLGIRSSQKSIVVTDFMQLRQNLSLKTYDNLMMLRIQWRFNKGRKRQRHVQGFDFDRETKDNKGLL